MIFRELYIYSYHLSMFFFSNKLSMQYQYKFPAPLKNFSYTLLSTATHRFR